MHSANSLRATALMVGLLPTPAPSRFTDHQIATLTACGFSSHCQGHFYRFGPYCVAADPQVPGVMLINSSLDGRTVWVHDEAGILAFMGHPATVN